MPCSFLMKPYPHFWTIPPELARAVSDITGSLDSGRLPGAHLVVKARDTLLGLPLERAMAIEAQVRDAGQFYRYRRPRISPWPWQKPIAPQQAMRVRPDLAAIFLCHGDGYVRQAALEFLDCLRSPFAVCLLAMRLNDWAEPVRKAAQACSDRLVPDTDPECLANALWFMLPRFGSWKRGGQALDQWVAGLQSPEVAAHLISRMRVASSGGQAGKVLRAVAQWPSTDPHLVDLARQAKQPGIRATAWRWLIDGEARRLVGFRVERDPWTQRQVRRLPQFETRPFDRPLALDDLLLEAASDRSVVVRRVAADGFMRHRHEVVDPSRLIDRLSLDPSGAVQSTVRFTAADLGLPIRDS